MTTSPSKSGDGARAGAAEHMVKILSNLPAVSRLIDLALDEDLGRGDITTDVCVGDAESAAAAATGRIVARAPLVVFGIDVARAVFARVDEQIRCTANASDGQSMSAGDCIMTAVGPASSILRAERTALNFLQRLSGVATMSRQYSVLVEGTGARVVDTRKTTPGYRVLEKAAVLAGGAGNHRADLGSGVLIKDNHIVAAGGVAAAVRRAVENAPHSLRVEVEVDTMEQLAEAIDAGAEVVLLDNMTPAEVARAVETVRAHPRRVLVEVSGGIRLETVRAYADAGADLISAGALTHSAPAVDISLDLSR